MSEDEDFNVLIYVPGSAAAPDEEGAVRRMPGKRAWQDLWKSKTVEVPAGQVFEQWSETIRQLLSRVNGWTQQDQGGWQIDEIDLTLTVSAQGKLMLIAEAGAEGSVKLVLRRKAAAG